MKTIDTLDTAREKEMTFEELGVNRTFYWAYMYSKEAEAETLDFADVIWDYDIEPIIEACRRFGLETITISNTFSGLPETIWGFEERGCKLTGMTKVRSRFTDWKTGEHEMKPAFLIEMPA